MTLSQEAGVFDVPLLYCFGSPGVLWPLQALGVVAWDSWAGSHRVYSLTIGCFRRWQACGLFVSFSVSVTFPSSQVSASLDKLFSLTLSCPGVALTRGAASWSQGGRRLWWTRGLCVASRPCDILGLLRRESFCSFLEWAPPVSFPCLVALAGASGAPWCRWRDQTCPPRLMPDLSREALASPWSRWLWDFLSSCSWCET